MLKAVSCVLVAGSLLTLVACSSSSSATGGSSGTSSGSGSGNGDDSGATGDDATTGGDDAAATCPNGPQMFQTLLAQYGGDGGGKQTKCLKNACQSTLDACANETCATCMSKGQSCLVSNIASCIDLDASLPVTDATPPDGGCTNPGPQCKALAPCCSNFVLLAKFANMPTLTTQAQNCTTNAASCDETTCMGTISVINTISTGACKGP